MIESLGLSDSSDGNGSLDESGCFDESDSFDASDSCRSLDENGSFDWIDQSDSMMRSTDLDSLAVIDGSQVFLLGSMISCCLLRSYFQIQAAQCPDQVPAKPEKYTYRIVIYLPNLILWNLNGPTQMNFPLKNIS